MAAASVRADTPPNTVPVALPPLQLGSRYFGFYRDGRSDLASSHLVPLADLVNHDDDPNAARSGAPGGAPEGGGGGGGGGAGAAGASLQPTGQLHLSRKGEGSEGKVMCSAFAAHSLLILPLCPP